MSKPCLVSDIASERLLMCKEQMCISVTDVIFYDGSGDIFEVTVTYLSCNLK